MTTLLQLRNFLYKFILVVLLIPTNVASSAILVGWSSLNLHTYTAGPFSQHQPQMGWAPPSSQMIGGVSAASISLGGNYIFLVDTGWGPKSSSMSSLLGFYELKIDFNDVHGQNKNVEVLKLTHFNDVDNKLTFAKQADLEFYGNNPINNKVDLLIKKKKLLTGGDLDPESFQVDYKGNVWVGDEYGPFLIKFNQAGKVLRPEIAIPNVISPDNTKGTSNNVAIVESSAGFEGMAINPQGNKLYPMLERPVMGDSNKTLRIYEFDIDKESFEPGYYLYGLDGNTTQIREMVAINDDEFLTLEQNEHFGSINGHVKKLYLFSTKGGEKNAYVKKTLLIDLMNIDDPLDLNRDGEYHFSFPKLTIESVVVIDKDTVLIINDNNFSERTEFIKVHLDEPINLAKFTSHKIDTKHWGARDINYFAWRGFHTQKLEWINIWLIFILLIVSFYTACKKVNLKQGGKIHWICLTLLILIYFLYNYLSLYYYASHMLRDLFIDLGIYQNRWVLQRIVDFGVVFLATTLFVLALFFYKNRYTKYSMAIFCLILGLKVIQAVSYHPIDAILEPLIGAGRVFDWAEFLLIMFLSCALFGDIKKNLFKHIA